MVNSLFTSLARLSRVIRNRPLIRLVFIQEPGGSGPKKRLKSQAGEDG